MLLEILTCVGHTRIIKLRSVEQKQKSTFVHNKKQIYSIVSTLIWKLLPITLVSYLILMLLYLLRMLYYF